MQETDKQMIKMLPFGILVVLLIMSAFGGFYTVQPGEVAFTKTFGKINQDIKEEGLYFKIPWISSVIKTNTRNIILTSEETAASSDTQDVTTKLAVNFSIPKDSVINLYTTVGKEVVISEQIVQKAISDSIKATTAKFKATETISKRQEVSDQMLKLLNIKLKSRGLMINQIDILNISFSKSFKDAIEAKVTAEQNALKAEKDLERVKFEALQSIERAKAEAEKIKIQAEAVTQQGGAEYVELQRIAKWNGVLPVTMLSNDSNTLLQLK